MQSAVVRPFQAREANAQSPQVLETRSIYVDQLVCDARIGVYESEVGRTQKVELSVWLEVANLDAPIDDDLSKVLDYGAVRAAMLDIVAKRHFGLQETLCEAIAARCMSMRDVIAVHVRSGKLEAFDDCRTVGCELSRRRVLP